MPEFRSKQRPALTKRAADLIGVYDATLGASGPYCLPEGISAVLQWIVDHCADSVSVEAETFPGPTWRTIEYVDSDDLLDIIAELRGER